METGLLIVIGVSALLEVRAELAGVRRQVYLFKPLTTGLILLLALLQPWQTPCAYVWAIAAGLAFSLLGDVLLMLPSDRFVAGLAAFLLAQLCYIVAFALRAPWGLNLLPLLAGVALLVCTYLCVARRAGKMRAPVAVYALVIVTMLYAAWACWYALGGQRPLLADLGACLFVASDLTLATNRFVHPFRLARLVVMVTYYAAQCLIALST